MKVYPCQACGQVISWVKRGDGSTHPPLLMVGEAIVVRDGIACTETVYVRHFCRDQDVADYEQAKVALRAKQGEKRDRANERRLWAEQYDRAKGVAWDQTRVRSCPKCGVEPDQRCEDLAKRAKGVFRNTSWSHTERFIEPTEEIGL